MAETAPGSWDQQTDVLIVGSGGSGLVAALAAQPKDVVVLEKAPWIGGTTAVSGGGLWLPNSRPVVESVGEYPAEKVRAYLRRCAGKRVDEELINIFVELAPKVLDFMESETALQFQFAGYPDYHTDWEEGRDEGNMVEPTLFDGTRLGERLADVRNDPHHTFPVPASEIYEVGGHAKFAQVADFEELERRDENDQLATGRALIAGLYEGCLDNGVVFETEAPVQELVVEENEVVGAVATIDGERIFIGADAVVIAAGGMDWDEDMRENFLRGPVTGPATPPSIEGDGIKMGMDVGAGLGNTNEAWWFPTGHVPGQTWEDGSPLYSMIWGRTLPGSIIINEAGERFCNEAGNYHDLTKRFHTFDPRTYDYENIPAYMVVDSTYREQYSLLTVAPGEEAPDWVAVGDSLQELAMELEIDFDGLKKTVSKFNEHATDGSDPAFGRGETAYDNFVGDPDTAHPNLGPVNEPPFYAIEVHSGIIGTKGGLKTDANGGVLDVSGEPITGLYAASNSTAHVMGMGYAGAGATLGPNVVFGYQAGRHASM